MVVEALEQQTKVPVVLFGTAGKYLYVVKVNEAEVEAADDFVDEALKGLPSVPQAEAHEVKLETSQME